MATLNIFTLVVQSCLIKGFESFRRRSIFMEMKKLNTTLAFGAPAIKLEEIC